MRRSCVTGLLAVLCGGVGVGLSAVSGRAQAPAETTAGAVLDLPTSKALGVVPGRPQRLNSLPISMALSPDGRYAVTVNAGFGTAESGYHQSLAVLDTTTGMVTDFPEALTAWSRAYPQTLYSGLQFSGDGRRLYASIASTTDPTGKGAHATGNGVVVYGFAAGKLTREKILPIGLQRLAAGRETRLIGGEAGVLGIPYPAALALLPAGAGGRSAAPAGDRLLVADNLSDDVLLMDAASGAVVKRFDLSEVAAVPGTYPIALAVSADGRRGFVALWNASEVAELDLAAGTVGRKVALLKPKVDTVTGSHPCALEMGADGRLYVALSNRDAVAVVETAKGAFRTLGYFDARLPGQSYFGAEPEALALSADGRRLYAGEAATDAVAVIDTRRMTAGAARKGFVEPLGFVPTEWMPMSMATGRGPSAGKLFLATAKGRGTGPNNFPQVQTPEEKAAGRPVRPFTYIPTLLHGSLATLEESAVGENLKAYTAEAVASNRMRAGREVIRFADGEVAGYTGAAGARAVDGSAAAGFGPIKHIIYIIKENRTYDQLFGDLEKDGKPVGNGDPSLTMYGESITPNQHALALQFGVLDNFFDSGEVSGDGHVWSNAAIGTDYLEKTWQGNYRNGQRSYDYEGMVAEGYPLLQHIPDVVEPASGYLWGNLASHGRTYYHFGEYISTTFCNDLKAAGPPVASEQGPLVTAVAVCAKKDVKPGEALPAEWGGGVNKWAWPIPLIARNVATKPELVGHFAAEAPDFELRVPDQIRVEIFLRHLKAWEADRAAGHDTMPNFINLRLPNDHTAGTRPGEPTPRSSVADNDLAIGRAVEAISHSPYWADTAFFILEDDAQNGADHVDAHRSDVLVVSKYAPRGAGGGPFVDSTFYSTVSTIRTMETLLGLPPMNNNDAFSSLMAPEFTGPGDQPAFTADTRNRDNGLIYTANAKTAVGAAESMKMDFRHADRANADKLNLILWQDAMGAQPPPAQLLVKHKRKKDDDDD